jgi:hypothetical protein
MTIAEILDKAADLIEPEGAWTRDYYAVTAVGNYTAFMRDDACRFCMVGAVARAAKAGAVAEIEGGPVGAFLKDFLGTKYIHAFNDTHTKPEVVSKLREAASLAREQGL